MSWEIPEDSVRFKIRHWNIPDGFGKFLCTTVLNRMRWSFLDWNAKRVPSSPKLLLANPSGIKLDETHN